MISSSDISPKTWEQASKLIESWPPLTEEQCERIAQLLGPVEIDTTRGDAA